MKKFKVSFLGVFAVCLAIQNVWFSKELQDSLAIFEAGAQRAPAATVDNPELKPFNEDMEFAFGRHRLSEEASKYYNLAPTRNGIIIAHLPTASFVFLDLNTGAVSQIEDKESVKNFVLLNSKTYRKGELYLTLQMQMRYRNRNLLYISTSQLQKLAESTLGKVYQNMAGETLSDEEAANGQSIEQTVLEGENSPLTH